MPRKDRNPGAQGAGAQGLDSGLTIQALTPERWPDLEDLFGPTRGATSGCWCMWLRVPGTTFKAMARDDRKAAFQSLVAAGPPPGLLAYAGEQAVGWCAIAPRQASARFQSARPSCPLGDADQPEIARVYAITCFFIRSSHRGRGLMRILSLAAIDHARAEGAAAIEACAIEPDKPLTWGDGFVGMASVFRALGFIEIARRSPRRPLFRLML